uniref:Family with sequence similarity 96, member B n=1 Tax=Nothobranchius furzeri TaxID=105023 RepID=A0A1A7ZH23_NOTFU
MCRSSSLCPSSLLNGVKSTEEISKPGPHSASRLLRLGHSSVDGGIAPNTWLVNDAESTVGVEFTPTIPHCSMATLIGLSIKVKLLRSLPDRFKIDVHITPGTHASEEAVNKQLADKERVAAALENSSLLEVVNQCLSSRNI